MSLKYQAVRGTHDRLPEDVRDYVYLENLSRALFTAYGYGEIRTPIFEALELFQRSLGETTDVVEKEMFLIQRDDVCYALRPEGTAGVVRAFVEHHLDQKAPFCKLFYMGPMFRAERPQKGRYREFYQIGGEYFGNATPAADAELIGLIHTLYQRLGITDTQLKLNSLGCDDCRPVYRKRLIDYLKSKESILCEDCKRRIEKNPLRALDCKIDGPKLMDAPTVDGSWCEACKTHFSQVQALLKVSGVPFVLTPRLVRGLDYYIRTVFEVTTTALGSQDALAAGGRYDKLVKEVGGPEMPGIGFALGAERTVLAWRAMREKNAAPALPKEKIVFVAAMGEAAALKAFEILHALRQSSNPQNVCFEGGFFHKKLGAQLNTADRIGASLCLILGEDELQKNVILLRDLKTGDQKELPLNTPAILSKIIY